jgi:hypothetical protein
MMRKSIGLCALAIAGVALSGGEEAHAVGITSPGVACHGNDPTFETLITRQFGGTSYIDSVGRGHVVCPMTVDHTIGATADFDVHLVDNNNNAADSGFLCIGTVLDAEGDIIATSPQMTTGAAFAGFATRTASVAAVAAATNSYFVQCFIPALDFGQPSSVKALRVD